MDGPRILAGFQDRGSVVKSLLAVAVCLLIVGLVTLSAVGRLTFGENGCPGFALDGRCM